MSMRFLGGLVLAAGLTVGTAAPASAHGFSLFIGGGGPIGGPAYYPAPPVYYAPAPVYYAPPPVVYAPPPAFYGPPPIYGWHGGFHYGRGRRW